MAIEFGRKKLFRLEIHMDIFTFHSIEIEPFTKFAPNDKENMLRIRNLFISVNIENWLLCRYILKRFSEIYKRELTAIGLQHPLI